jgi:ABC-type molybdenum transport system ATPase subunit/photorepair protein PhrA
MKKITEITLCNYRAFLNKPNEEDKYKISLPKGENLLIYGENGSGKSITNSKQYGK